jgi:signal peptidase I
VSVEPAKAEAVEEHSKKEEVKQEQTIGQWVWGWVKSIAVALIIFFFVQALLFKAFRIISDSLEPTLLVGDWLFINKAVYGATIPFTNVRLPAFREPRAGELIVLVGVEPDSLTIVKRVIGVAGDTLEMRNDSIFRNNRYLSEPYVQHTNPMAQMDPAQRQRTKRWQLPHLVDTVDRTTYLPDLRNWGPFVIPEGHLFTMGDNRDSSYDGRHWGLLPRAHVIGHPMFIYWSYDPNKWPLPIVTAVRWNRLLRSPS